jgi:tRNA-modifying protein YgfZ
LPHGGDNCAAQDPSVRYSTFDMIALRGADALAFAQAQLASDVAALGDGRWEWSAYLSPQGRTIALIVLVRHAPDAIDLLVPAARGADLATRLQRYVFRTRVAIAADPALQLHARAGSAAGPGTTVEGGPGSYRVGLAEGIVLEPGTGVAAGEESRFRAFLVDAAIPLLAGAAVEAQTPHALGLDALGAISTTKGCYPGQEIVARTHFLGRNKRHLCRFEGSAPTAPEPGDAIDGETGHAAEIILALNRAEGTVGGLAVAHEQALTGGTAFRLGASEVTLARVR